MALEKRTLALLKVHATAVIFSASGIFGALIASSADTLVLGRVIIAFVILSLYFLYKKQPLAKLSTKQMDILPFRACCLRHTGSLFCGGESRRCCSSNPWFCQLSCFCGAFWGNFLSRKTQGQRNLLIGWDHGGVDFGHTWIYLQQPSYTRLALGRFIRPGVRCIGDCKPPQYEPAFWHASKLVTIPFCDHCSVTILRIDVGERIPTRLVLDFLYRLSLHQRGLYAVCFQPWYH